ncbi:hypothetical protein BN2475_180014 [Paraburkholderia ribeironis]|uniref:Uncharacterized protein n=1 Tax=Paraburkholderia ribeironis TaxID=1247936 RepID=A0A1N7RUV0_9BURK|nr:hypothetical protein BN2475_180014 [Paraburkholderia ribeironis]
MAKTNESNATWVLRPGSNRLLSSPKLTGWACTHKLMDRFAN